MKENEMLYYILYICFLVNNFIPIEEQAKDNILMWQIEQALGL